MKLSQEEEYANAVDKALVGEEIEGPSLPPLDNIADIQTATRGKTKVTEQETGTANVSAEDEYIDQFGNVQKMQQVSGDKFKPSPKQPLLVSQAQDAIADINAGQVQDPIQYRRKDYEHWTDEDLDTADTREEVLLASATGDVRVQKNKYTGKNQVTDGQWVDPLSGETVRHRSGIEVDHIAPLHWVNAHGGAAWSPEKKREFANDQDFLIAASKLQNQVKGASGTDKYLPPNTKYVPEYVSLWSALLTKYPSLRMSDSEAEEFAQLEANVEVYKQKDAQYQAGELSIEELNKFARETFKNDVHTAAYLQKQYDRSSPDAQRQAEERSIFAEWAEANPDIKFKGSSGVAATASPLRDPSFMDKLDASFSSLNSIAQLMDMSAEWEAQRYGQNGIPRELLLKDVPEAYHADIIAASEEHNDDTAMVVRENILEDLHNNSIYDSMPWYAQLGFGAGAVIADPLTLIPAMGVAKATVGATRSIRGWQQHGAFKALPLASTWFAAGSTETAVQAAPKLAADYTYNSSDYILDTVAGGLLGAGIGTAIHNRGLVTQFWNKSGDTKKINELREVMDVWDDELGNMDTREPAKVWDDETVNEEGVDFSEKYDLSPEGEARLAELEKEARRKYAQEMNPVQGIVTETEKAEGTARVEEIRKELGENSVDTGSAKDVPIDYIRDLEKEGYILTQMLKGNKAAEGAVQKLREGIDLDSYAKEVLAWEKKPLTAQQKAQGKAAYAPVEAALRDVNNFDRPARPADGLPSAQQVEIQRRQYNKKLKEDYVDSLDRSNDQLQVDLKDHITREIEPTESVGFTKRRLARARDEGFDTENVYYHGTRGPDFAELQAGHRTNGFVYYTQDAEYAGEYAQGKHSYGANDLIVNFEAVEREYPGSVDMSTGRVTGDIPRDVAFDSFDVPLERDGIPLTQTEINEGAQQLLSELLQGARLLPVFLKKGKTWGSKENPIDFREVEAKGADAVRQEGYTQVYTTDGLAVLDSKDNTRSIFDTFGEDTPPTRKEYESTAVTEQTPHGATLATEIHNGQAVLVEVKSQPGETAPTTPVPQVPNASHNIKGDIKQTLENFSASGEKEAAALERKSNNLLQSAVRLINKMGMTDLSTILAESPSDAVKYVATRVTEVAQGFGGKSSRKASAALLRDSKFRSAQMHMVPAYTQALQDYVASLGRGRVKQFRARQEAGVDNPDVELFNREFIKLQELRRQGASIDEINPAVVKFADDWNKSMDVSFDHLVNARVAGFSRDRKIEHYYPQSWLPRKLDAAERKHGKDKIIDVLTKGYKTASKQGDTELPEVEARKLAERMYEHIKSLKEQNQMDDEFISTAGQDARSKSRLNINTTAEIDGLSVMDLLDTEVVAVGTKYHNRMAGWSSLSESTNGLLNSDKSIQEFIKHAKETGASKQELQYLNDVMEMMLGKPVRGGLSPVLREFKDAAALTQLGGKGMAQLAETGQVITRGILNAFSNPDNLRKMMKDAGIEGDVSDLAKEAQQLSHMTDDMEWIERQATHVDTAESVGRAKLAATWLASKVTGGNRVKANAARGLGKLSGFNMIRRAQTRISHGALSREIADHMLKGKSGIGEARLKDLGILDNNGKNPWLAQSIRKHATFDTDGNVLKMNFDKWNPETAKRMSLALLRFDAQQIQRTMIGELPGWMNSPMASLLMQYMEMPLVAMNKSLGRATAFADREAVVGTILSAMTAGMAMSGRQLVVAGSDAAAGQEFRDVDLDVVNTAKYINAAGMFPDMYDIVMNEGYAAAQSGDSKEWADFVLRQIPVYGLMKGYYETVTSDNAKQLIDNAQTLTPLGNTMLGDAFFTNLMEQF